MSELEESTVTFSSLSKISFGTFPALTTLDAQYCSQLRAICRENMIIALLKSAAELESFAREAEQSCAELAFLLGWAYNAFKVPMPSYPLKVPLNAFPLNYNAVESEYFLRIYS